MTSARWRKRQTPTFGSSRFELPLIERQFSGLEYLSHATTLLQRARLAHPTYGVWEAADLQWWWRRARPTDDTPQQFWFDDNGLPVAATIVTDWGGRLGLDVITMPDLDPQSTSLVWRTAFDSIVADAASPVEVMVDDENALAISLLDGARFHAVAGTGTAAWMDAADLPTVSPLADGYRPVVRNHHLDTPPHFIARNGSEVGARLQQTSLYRADLDLAVVDARSEPVAYGLFWYDPHTKVGFVEPMGTNEGHRQRGLARHILTSGLEKLVAVGVTRLKVNWDNDNKASVGLYTDVGFVPTMTTSMYLHEP